MKFQKLADMVLRGIADCGMRIADCGIEIGEKNPLGQV